MIFAALSLCCCPLAFSSCSEQGTTLQLQGAGFSLRWRLLLQSMGSRMHQLNSCIQWVQQVQHGLNCPLACGIVQPDIKPHIPCIGRWSSSPLDHQRSQICKSFLTHFVQIPSFAQDHLSGTHREECSSASQA